MPLDRQAKGLAGDFDPLHQPVRGKGHRLQRGTDFLNPLVVQAVNPQFRLSQNLPETAGGFDPHRMGQGGPGRETVGPGVIVDQGVRELIRDMGIERPAQGDVNHLQAATNPEKGFGAFGSQANQAQFERVAGRVNAVNRRVRLAAKDSVAISGPPVKRIPSRRSNKARQ